MRRRARRKGSDVPSARKKCRGPAKTVTNAIAPFLHIALNIHSHMSAATMEDEVVCNHFFNEQMYSFSAFISKLDGMLETELSASAEKADVDLK